jgi:hypothetical protein
VTDDARLFFVTGRNHVNALGTCACCEFFELSHHTVQLVARVLVRTRRHPASSGPYASMTDSSGRVMYVVLPYSYVSEYFVPLRKTWSPSRTYTSRSRSTSDASAAKIVTSSE